MRFAAPDGFEFVGTAAAALSRIRVNCHSLMRRHLRSVMDDLTESHALVLPRPISGSGTPAP